LTADLPPNRPRAVFDCGVFLQAFLSGTGPASACLDSAESGYVDLIVSSEILSEVREVLLRPEIRSRRPLTLRGPLVDAFLERLSGISTMFAAPPRIFEYPRDPDDEVYINLAIASGARYLVARDKDLLDLARTDSPDAIALRRMPPSLRILDPVEFLRQTRYAVRVDRAR